MIREINSDWNSINKAWHKKYGRRGYNLTFLEKICNFMMIKYKKVEKKKGLGLVLFLFIYSIVFVLRGFYKLGMLMLKNMYSSPSAAIKLS